ncbi:MAG: ComF family protein [Firmicutes bacterium HGW-Firmicutes-14]|nr:MAG: ComF family protein [Firmicutes bacterium HGW-Firmicutes-14]
MEILEKILDLFFPGTPECIICGSQGRLDSGVCRGCLERVVRREGYFFCPVCGRYSFKNTGFSCDECHSLRPAFYAARSVGPYKGVLKEAIYLFKYRGRRSLAGFFGLLMAELFLAERVFANAALLVPVPLSREKMKLRGFNQSELAAAAMGRVLGLPVSHCLLRTKETTSQSKLDRGARAQNVRGAFAFDGRSLTGIPGTKLSGKDILLIDDIFTTGATVGECTGVLLEQGADRVGVMTFASGLQEKK